MTSRKEILVWPAVGLLACLLMGCGGGDATPAEEQPEFPVPAVVGAVRVEPVAEMLELVGSLAARDEVQVVSELDGTVEALLFEEGAKVTAGQPLVALDEVRWKARLDEAEARFKLAKSDYLRGRDLLKGETISQQEFDRLESAYLAVESSVTLAREDLADCKINAPFDGVVDEQLVSKGQFVTRGQPLTRVVRMDPLEAVFNVPERYLGALQNGQEILFSSAAFAGMDFAGRVFFIAPGVDPASRTVKIKAEVANPERLLKPGMFGSLSLALRTNEKGLTIPEAAVIFSGDQPRVVAVNDEGRSEFRMIKLGRLLDGRVEVLEGLSEGGRVVVEGHQKMGPGMLVMATAGSAQYGVEPQTPPAAPAE